MNKKQVRLKNFQTGKKVPVEIESIKAISSKEIEERIVEFTMLANASDFSRQELIEEAQKVFPSITPVLSKNNPREIHFIINNKVRMPKAGVLIVKP